MTHCASRSGYNNFNRSETRVVFSWWHSSFVTFALLHPLYDSITLFNWTENLETWNHSKTWDPTKRNTGKLSFSWNDLLLPVRGHADGTSTLAGARSIKRGSMEIVRREFRRRVVPAQPSKRFFHVHPRAHAIGQQHIARNSIGSARKVCRLASYACVYVHTCARRSCAGETERSIATHCAKRLNLWNGYNGYPFSMPRRGIQCATRLCVCVCMCVCVCTRNTSSATFASCESLLRTYVWYMQWQ